MATTTTKLGLTKPDTTDLVDIAVINTDFDKIDAASGATICTSSTRPGTPWNGQIIFETDTLGAFVWRSATSTWTSMGGSTVSSDPPATAANGDLWWDSDNGKLYIYYTDVDGSQWVSVMPNNTTVDVSQNYLINGDFSINQRNFSSVTSDGVYGFDRWKLSASTGVTWTPQVFTPGAAPVAGYEATNYSRLVVSGQSAALSYAGIGQAVENVRALAGQTATISFWAKAASGTPKVGISALQAFGSGGSSSVISSLGIVTISTTWARYSVTGTIPSIGGKTVGSNSSLVIGLYASMGTDGALSAFPQVGIQNNTFDFWGVQVEKGSVATSFKTATGTIQGELAACQRYYVRMNADTDAGLGWGNAVNSTSGSFSMRLPVPMRAIPGSTVDWSGLRATLQGYDARNFTSLTFLNATKDTVGFSASWSTWSGVMASLGTSLSVHGATNSSYIGFSAEL